MGSRRAARFQREQPRRRGLRAPHGCALHAAPRERQVLPDAALASEARRRAEMPFVDAGVDDLSDLRDGEAQLVVGREVMRADAQACLRAEVTEDLPFCELLVHGLELGRSNGHGPTASGWIARAADVEARLVEQIDQELRLAHG